MMNVDGIQPVSAPKAVQPTEAIVTNQGQTRLGEISDVVEISTAAILAAKIHEIPEVRADLVARVKEQIAAGAYETEQRLEVTVDRIMEELFPEP